MANDGVTLKEREIALLILRLPKTLEELREEAGMEYWEIRDLVKGMLKKGLVERRSGFPTKYYLGKEFWGEAMQWERAQNEGKQEVAALEQL